VARRLAELAALVDGEVRGDGELEVEDIATLAAAGPRQLSFLTNPRYRDEAAASRAGAVLVGPDVELGERTLLVAKDPYYALALLLGVFHPPVPRPPGVHPTAVVGRDCVIHPAAHVGALAVVGDRSRVDEGAAVLPLAVVGADCSVGARTVVHSHAVLYDRTEVGCDCVLHAGVVLGSDGFGYATHRGEHVKVPQVGRVVVEDGVEIGANSAIDRAMLEETRLGAGSKIDNLVQVGHNVRIGRGCIVVSQAGIAGSTALGDYVVLAGQAGVAGHLRLGKGARVAAKSAVFKDVPAGAQVAGIPATDAAKWRRQQALLQRLEVLQRRVRALERRLGAEEEGGEE
jgi:UDP-3-O-[3-hydroxymyristoyl] glucosamine N-acyltransferase